jgi:serine/threonine protein kinase
VRVTDSSLSGRVARAESVPVGKHVGGRYRLLGELGTGAFGTVCRAEDEATGHLVAVRLLPRALASASAAAQGIRRASRSLPSVSAMHPALVRVLDYGETDGDQPFIAMELVTGQSLSTPPSSAPLDIAQGLRMAIELGGALETLHNSGYVHGGLRPRNVVLSDDGQLKLLDVELCGLRDQLELTDLVGGKPPQEHLSPEQIRHDPITEKSDIYAFALLVYELLCGLPPFQAGTREAEATGPLTAPVPLRQRRRTIPRSVDSVIMAALDTRPERRPFMHVILNQLWAELNRPVSDRRERVSMVAFGAVIASLLLALGWMLSASRLADHPPTAPPRQETKPAPTIVQPEPTKPSADAESATLAEPARPAPQPAAPSSPSRPPSSPPPSARKVERRERVPDPPTSPAPTPERPNATSGADDPDPGLVVDWLLERAAGRRQ